MYSPISLPPTLLLICEDIFKHGGNAILVGGSVRDFLFTGETPKDLDVEVYQLQTKDLERILSQYGKVSLVGKSFGVLKLHTPEMEYDFSLPRKEKKVSSGHKGFHIEANPYLSFAEAAKRRDFTMNAIGYDLKTHTYLDPFDGKIDLKNQILRHIGTSFSEDPLRVLRGMQFAGRFTLTMAPETKKLCQRLDLSELPKERVFEEFKKLFLKATKPSLGLTLAREIGILEYFPELQAMIGVEQDPQWHPEGDVWIHTLMVIDEAAKLRTGIEKTDLELMFSALCHDLGKPITTQWERGRWRSPAHDTAGMKPTASFLRKLTNESSFIDSVSTLVKEHLRPAQLYKDRDNVSNGAIRRLALRISITDLVRLAKADHFGRTTPDAIAREFPAGDWLLEKAQHLTVQQEPPKPWLMGRHLIELGMQPGPQMGEMIQESFQLQMDDTFSNLEEVLLWAKQKIQLTSTIH